MARKEGRNKTARKPRTWAQEAGKYYRKNVGKNGIESFTDVLKSTDFKKQHCVKNGMKRGGDGDAAPAPANTTECEIQMPLNNVIGIMKTGGMKMGIMKTGEMMINKCKSMKMKMKMKMKKKGKMTKKKSLKNKKMTKKYVGGENYKILNMDGTISGYAVINNTNTINNNTDKNDDETVDDDDHDESSYNFENDPQKNKYLDIYNPKLQRIVSQPKPSRINQITNMFRRNP